MQKWVDKNLQDDETSALIAFFGYHEDTGTFAWGDQSYNVGVNGIASYNGVCHKKYRASITEIRRYTGKNLDVEETSAVS